MKIQNLFRPLEQLEQNLSVLYKLWSEHFATDPEAAMLFYRMSLEEKAHAALIQYQKRLVRQNPDFFEEVTYDLQEIADVCILVAEAGAARQLPSLKKAVELALHIEGSAAESHYRNAVVASRPQMGALIKSLVKADLQHVQALRDFAKSRGYEKLATKSIPRFPKL